MRALGIRFSNNRIFVTIAALLMVLISDVAFTSCLFKFGYLLLRSLSLVSGDGLFRIHGMSIRCIGARRHSQ